MATTTFLSAIPEMAAMVSGCPSPIIERYVSKVVIELCRRASIWRVRLSPIPLTAGVYNYVPLPPPNTVMHNIITATLTMASPATTIPLDIHIDKYVIDMYPRWPDIVDTGQPLAIFQSAPDSINVYPVPNAITTYNINLFATIRPTASATGWDSALQDEFREVVFHGVLYYIMLMPNRVWSDPAQAQIHGKMYSNLIAEARAKANKSYTRADVFVKQSPWA